MNTTNPFHKSHNELQLELIEIVAAKEDPAKFNVLYERYYKPIFIFIHRRVGEEDLTADLASLVFLKAMVSIKKYEFKNVPFSAWLFRIALNEINMYFRKNNNVRIISLEASHLTTISEEIDKEGTEEIIKKMMNVLTKLPLDSIQLIELRFFEKRSFFEIGSILGITENNAKVKVYRVLEKLKNLILDKR